MLQWLWRVGGSLPVALASGVLLLLMTALFPMASCAALYGAALYGAAWCWSRHPHLRGRAAAGAGVALAAGFLAGLLNEARERVLAFRGRLDPDAARRAYVRYDDGLPRLVQPPRPW